MKEIQPQDRYVEINGLRLHYLEWGDGTCPTILLLHGLTSHAHIWDDFGAAFCGEYRLIGLDQRGHGESEWSGEAAYSIDDHFADIAGLIEAINLSDLIIMGHSMGGRNALFYAACHPETVSRLILVDARPGNNAQSSQTLKEHLTTLPLEASCIEEVCQSIRLLYPLLPREVIDCIARHGYREGHSGTLIPKFDVRMGIHIEQSGYATEELWPYLPSIPVPCLVIRGMESTFLSRADATRMCRFMPQAHLVEIPGATHMPAHENPEAFNRAVAEFLDH